MVFHSAAFLFLFFPVIFLLYRLVPGKTGRSILLCAASLLFYAFGGIAMLPVLLLAVIGNYLFGLWLAHGETRSKTALVLAVVFDLALLGVYKYADFFLSGVNALARLSLPLPGFALPLGISFFTFHGISYVADVYRGEDAEKNIGRLFLYLAFFPRLVAGPIVQYRDARAQLLSHPTDWESTVRGLRRFTKGLVKKLLLAEGAAAVADAVYALAPHEAGTAFVWLSVLAYCLQIFFDFSGYSDMAIGLGRLFGFTFPENFDSPYVSRSLSEFWRRWHMTLNRWFVQYLYIPLGGSRKGQGRTVINKLLVFLATGLWHGAGWTYILWGLWHGVFVSAEGLCKGFRARAEKSFFGRALCRVYTLLVVVLGFAMFRAPDVSSGFAVIGELFAFSPCRLANPEILNGARIAALLAGLIFCLPVEKRLEAAAERTPALWHVFNVLTLIGLAVSILALSAGGFAPFIYQQF